MMYFGIMKSYQCDHFQVFCNVDNIFATITQDWVINFNIGAKKPYISHG
jgi:hypothetical protein